MLYSRSLDALVRERLRKWPQHPPGLEPSHCGCFSWLRGRPLEEMTSNQPYLKLPGSKRLRTLPDGLWLNFGGDPVEPFVDIFAIEACGSLQNLLDKRSRFAPSTHSLLAVCPLEWLFAPAIAGDPTLRWQLTGIFDAPPARALIVPVRDIHVMYGLKGRHYVNFVRSNVPHPHEYFVPMEALTAERGDESPQLRALVARATAAANFLSLPSTEAAMEEKQQPWPRAPQRAEIGRNPVYSPPRQPIQPGAIVHHPGDH